MVPPPNYVYDGRAALAGLEAPLHQSMFIANAVWIIVACVAAVALFNTLTLSVLERRREIGVLRAMGSSRRFTLQMVLAEAAAIGVVGGVLGLLFGCTDQWLLQPRQRKHREFQRRFPAQSDGVCLYRRRAGAQPARVPATRAAGGATEHHRGRRRQVGPLRPLAADRSDQKPNGRRSVNSWAKGSVKGSVNESMESRAGSLGSMNVFMVSSATPKAGSPEPYAV